MAHDREVGGIRCLEVLELLQAYVDGDAQDHEISRINMHLVGCDWCAKFGGKYSALVQTIQNTLRTEGESPLDPSVLAALAIIRGG